MLVVFSCNSCPFVVGGKDIEGWEGRYNEVFDAAEKNKVKMVLVNSNAARRDRGESIKDMKKRAQEKGIKAMYVLDKGSALADDFGARTTPHVFLFNSAKKLVYAGAIDDNCNDSKQVKEKWLENALNKLNAGEKIDVIRLRRKRPSRIFVCIFLTSLSISNSCALTRISSNCLSESSTS